ncbi:MAG: hypothetical protein RBU37_00910 [Myxococcota bacterium]|nr:hypothetical protein [Myxococcota bacterium]
MRGKTRFVLLLLLLSASFFACHRPPKEAPEVQAEPPQEVLYPSVDRPVDTQAQAPAPNELAPTPAVDPAQAPKIVAVQAAYDFGKVKQGEEVSHVFKIRNEGKGDLTLLSARSS